MSATTEELGSRRALAGVAADPKVVQRILGHASATMTRPHPTGQPGRP
jgi:integrase